MLIQYGEWKIKADVIKTRMYYYSFEAPNDQFSRNFQAYCDRLSREERDFFNSFGIDPKCVYVESLGVLGKRTAPTGGYYYIFGKYENTPSQPEISVYELMKNGFAGSKDNSIKIGAFRFEFQLPEDPNADIPEDMPKDCICLRFWCEDMQWFLPEKGEKTLKEVSHMEKILAKIASKLKSRKSVGAEADCHATTLVAANGF
ncbi:MAG: hypothetical protein IJX51_06045 [Clostridia bacterium]|nr:hypothetical protein [Clostridia bacterium]